MLPQPSRTELWRDLGSHVYIDNDPPGIIEVDPFTMQCAVCGEVAVCPEGTKWPFFLVISGWGFHVCTRGSEGRLCRDCKDATTKACESSRCKR